MGAPRLVIASLEELPDHVGAALGPSSWLTVGQERIDAFADATDDRQWIHVDPERAARESPFEGTVAHGYLTLSLLPRLLSEILAVEGIGRAINTGLDKLRLQSPVPAGSRLRLHAEIARARRIPGGGVRVTIGARVEVEGATRPALSAQLHMAYFPPA